MGERLSGGRGPGRRHGRPDGPVPGHAPAPVGSLDEAALEELLATLLRAGQPAQDSDGRDGERRAVAAFRAARDGGAHRARTRRRDDWRPRSRRLGSHSVKALLGVLLGGLTLSGVAVAAIGSAGSATDGSAEGGRPTHSSPDAVEPSSGRGPGDVTKTPDRPAAARDTEAHCRAYERVEGRGKALDAAAWQRLTRAAGGAEKVDAYCAERLRRATPEARPGGAAAPGPARGQGMPEAPQNPEAAGNNADQPGPDGKPGEPGNNSGGAEQPGPGGGRP